MKRTKFAFSDPFFVGVAVLLVFGVLMIYDASVVYSLNVFGGKYHFLLKQAGWASLGFIGLFFASKVDLKWVKKTSFPLFTVSLMLLLLVLIPGVGSEYLGARRWLNLKVTSLQPAELAKLSFIIYYAFLVPKLKKNKNHLLFFLSLLGVVVGLIFLEPDLGTALVVGIVGAGMYFLSGAPLKHFFFLAPLVLAVGLFFIVISPYRRQRLLTFLNPQKAASLEEGYHTNQALIAIGSGGIFGLGPGRSRQKYAYLPEVTTDSIFAILCEEFGFLGGTAFLGLLGFTILRGFKIAAKAQKLEYKLMAGGVMLWFSAQSLLNLSAISGLLPLTGVPLPLISYGGSAIVFLLIGLGLVLNTSRQ